VNPARAGSMGRAASRAIGRSMREIALRAEARNYAEVAHKDEDDPVWSAAWERLRITAVLYFKSLSRADRAALKQAGVL
jgi:hypothetical protein